MTHAHPRRTELIRRAPRGSPLQNDPRRPGKVPAVVAATGMSEASIPSGTSSGAAHRPAGQIWWAVHAGVQPTAAACFSALTASLDLARQSQERCWEIGADLRYVYVPFLRPRQLWPDLGGGSGRGDIGPEDDFFELGGDSLLSAVGSGRGTRSGPEETCRCHSSSKWACPAFGKCAQRCRSATLACGGSQHSWDAMSALDSWVSWAASHEELLRPNQPVFQIQDPLGRR